MFLQVTYLAVKDAGQHLTAVLTCSQESAFRQKWPEMPPMIHVSSVRSTLKSLIRKGMNSL